jgi:hypothetical protein
MAMATVTAMGTVTKAQQAHNRPRRPPAGACSRPPADSWRASVGLAPRRCVRTGVGYRAQVSGRKPPNASPGNRIAETGLKP